MQLDEIAALISPPLFNKSFLAGVEMVWALPGQQVDVGKATNEKTISMFNQPNHHVTNFSISQFQLMLSNQHHTTVIWVKILAFVFILIALVKVLYSIYTQ